MIYVKDITVLKDTMKTAYQCNYFWLEYGTIHQVDINFPAGCAGLVGVRLKQGSHQIIPSNSGEWFTGDNVNISFPENYLFSQSPYYIEVQTYNEDDLYQHKIILRLGLLRGYLGKKISNFEDLGGL